MSMKPIDIREALSMHSLYNAKATYYVSKGHYQPPSFQLHTQLFRVGFYMLGLCVDGHLKIRVNFKEYEVQANTFMTFTPTTIVQVLSKSDDFRVRMVLFDKDFVLAQSNNSQLLDNLGFFENNGVTSLQLSPDNTAQLIPYFELIKQKYEADEGYAQDVSRNLILALLYQCANMYANEPSHMLNSTRKEEIKAMFIALVKKHCKQERKIVFYARKLYVSPKHLTETIKAETGKTAGELVDEAVILEAKLLLSNRNKTIQQVSDDLHFANQAFFTKFFKRHTTLTPTAWRVQNQ